MSSLDVAPHSSEPAKKPRSIPKRLTLAMLPIVVVVLLLSIVLVWNLVWSESASAFMDNEVAVWVVVGAVSLVALGSLFVTYRIGKSMALRIKDASTAARRMGDRDLVELFDALRSPSPNLKAMAPLNLDTAARDEVGDLSRSISWLHDSLIEVAARQMESLRLGVSSIFVTLARRNSGLVDRQLALLDQLESREDDPETLAGFYQVDQLAARMRRNAESLLVLAGSEAPRVWAKPTDMSDVVRAAVSEVAEYQRIEVLVLEPARLSGGAVTDVAHLLAELLENAMQFSPPSEAVRVTGLFDVGGYELTVSDRGVGMSDPRVDELNRLLEKPPVLGLSVEPTMGMYVVAKLAYRHGLTVELIRGIPGVTAKVTIPRDHLEISKTPEPRPWETSRREQKKTLVDLTEPEMLLPAGSGVGGPGRQTSLAEPPTGDLPVRTPGQALGGMDPSPNVAAGVGSTSIKSSLVEYERGRQAARERSAEDGATTGDQIE